MTEGRDCPNLPCDVVFDPEEWPAAWIVDHRCPPPETPPPLGQRVRLIASLGGFLGRNRDGYPGPKALSLGRDAKSQSVCHRHRRRQTGVHFVRLILWVIGCEVLAIAAPAKVGGQRFRYELKAYRAAETTTGSFSHVLVSPLSIFGLT